jgi:hypothetical protein
LIPILSEWAMADDHVSSNQALSDLCSITGLKLTREDSEAWSAWWKKSERLFKPAYNLQTAHGRDLWMEAWKSGDEAARRILMRLWLFESKIDEDALIESATRNEGAIQVLGDLWQRKCLSPESMKKIVERFLKPKLIEVDAPDPKRGPFFRRVRIASESPFPFPVHAEAGVRSKVEVGYQPRALTEVDLDPPNLIMMLQDIRKVSLGGGEGEFPGKPCATAILEMRETDPSNGFREIWRVRWNLGPVELRNVPK